MGAAGHFPPRFTIVLGVQQPQHHSLEDQRALQVPFHVTACSHTCHHSGTNLWLSGFLTLQVIGFLILQGSNSSPCSFNQARPALCALPAHVCSVNHMWY